MGGKKFRSEKLYNFSVFWWSVFSLKYSQPYKTWKRHLLFMKFMKCIFTMIELILRWKDFLHQWDTELEFILAAVHNFEGDKNRRFYPKYTHV